MYMLQLIVSIRPDVKYLVLTFLSLRGPHISSRLYLNHAAIYENMNMVTILYRIMIHDGIGSSACQYIGQNPHISWHARTDITPVL